MKKLYGIADEDGKIYAADDAWALDKVELVPNFTWQESDFTDPEGNNWIIADRLAQLFGELCDSTGMTQKALAEYCGKTSKTFSNYATGKTPVPLAIWRLVEERKLKKY